mgnify:CR=1 FL=1
MRKIEQQMIRAIQQRNPGRIDNTELTVNPEHGLTGTVYLFMQPIATVTFYPGGAFDVYPNVETFKLFPTVTTCSRLSALGVNCKAATHARHITIGPERIDKPEHAHLDPRPVHHPAPTPLAPMPTPETVTIEGELA